MEKISFLNLPTPLEHLPRMSEHLGIDLYIKRDDLTSLGMGGNKLRKLEYLLADAKTKGATMLLTMGGAQTNHGRLTAAVAAKHGMKCAIVCIDNYPGELSANLLLDRLMGAEVILKKSDGRSESEQFAETAASVRAKYEAQGEVVYEIPIGGSNVVGMLGYLDCGVELNAQAKAMGIGDARLICGVGSIGTYLGLHCGLETCKSGMHLTGIAISPFEQAKEARIVEYFNQCKLQYGFDFEMPEVFDIEKGYTRGGYNNLCKEVRDAIYLMARKEAVILDPCYTGKAFAGLCDMVSEGKIKKGEKVIFLHTGGAPAIYTRHHREQFELELMDGVTILQ